MRWEVPVGVEYAQADDGLSGPLGSENYFTAVTVQVQSEAIKRN
jgi:hypothetical protein